MAQAAGDEPVSYADVDEPTPAEVTDHFHRLQVAKDEAERAKRAQRHVTDYRKFDGIDDDHDDMFVERIAGNAKQHRTDPIKVTLNLETGGAAKRGKFTLKDLWLRKTLGDLARVFHRKHAAKKLDPSLELTVARLELQRGSYVAKRVRLSALAEVGDALRAGDVLAVGTAPRDVRSEKRLPPLPGAEPDDFEPVVLSVRVGEEEARDAGFLAAVRVELAGPNGTVVEGYVEPNDDVRPPCISVACRPADVGPHVLTVSARGETLFTEDRFVAAPEPTPQAWTLLSNQKRAKLVEWIEACDAACSVDREDCASLPLPPVRDASRAAPAPPKHRATILRKWLPAKRRRELVALAKARGLYGPADCGSDFRRFDAPGATDGCAVASLRYGDAPDVVAKALERFPDCAPENVEVVVVHFPDGGFRRPAADAARRAPDGSWARRAGLYVALETARDGGELSFKRLVPRDVAEADGAAPAVGVSGADRDGAAFPGVSIALAPGDACAFATVDALGRPDERMDRGVGDVLAGEAWALQVWVHSPLNALRADGRLCLLKFTPKRVADEVHARVANVDVLPPEAYTTFEGDNAMPLLPEAPRVYLHCFASGVPEDVRHCVALRLKQSEFRRGRNRDPRFIYTAELVAPPDVLRELEPRMHAISRELAVPLMTTPGSPQAPGGYVVF